MAYAPTTVNLQGCFVLPETGVRFEYSNAEDNVFGAPHKIYVGNGEYRYATVKKTVAYVILDEIGGNPVVDKWMIRTEWSR